MAFLKELCHNLCVLIQSAHELGVEAVFTDELWQLQRTLGTINKTDEATCSDIVAPMPKFKKDGS